MCLGNPLHPEGPFRDCFAEGTDWITVPITNKAEFERWIAAYGEDSDFVLARVRGIFPRQAFNRFIRPDVVDEAMRRPVESSSDPLVMGVDVARFGDDVARAKRTRTFSTVDRTLKKPRRGDPIVAGQPKMSLYSSDRMGPWLGIFGRAARPHVSAWSISRPGRHQHAQHCRRVGRPWHRNPSRW